MPNDKRLTWKRSVDGYTDVGLRKGVTAYEAICKLADYEEAEAEAATDTEEVVHGRWVRVPSSDMMTGKAYKCSECNKMRYGSYVPNYCQNCGAKMDGERREGE
jgi:rubrerythrin